MTLIKFTSKLLIFSLVILSFTNIYLVANEFIHNYSNKTGIVLQNKQVLGGDFIAFYTAGLIFKYDRISLYQYETQKEVQKALYEGIESNSGFLSFAYPPLIAGFFSLFTSLSLENAYFTWLALSILMYAGAVLITSSTCNLSMLQKFLVLIISLGFPAFTLRTLGAGQTGAIGTLLLAILFSCLIKKKEFSGGFVAGFFYYKPPLFIFLLIWLLCTHSKKLLYGFISGAIPIIVLTTISVPIETLLDYIDTSLNYSYGGTRDATTLSVPHKGAGIYALITAYIPLSTNYIRMLYLVLFITSLFAVKKIKKLHPNQNTEVYYAFIISISIILSIHIVDYDLCMLILPFTIVAVELIRNAKYLSLIFGTSIIILFYIDLATPDIPRENYTLSSLSILCILWLVFLFMKIKSDAIETQVFKEH
jgi:hypothetical protein